MALFDHAVAWLRRHRVTREEADALLTAGTVEACTVCLTMETPP